MIDPPPLVFGPAQPWPRQGFLRALLLTLKLKEKGVMSCGPPCGSFVWINSATSGRRKDRPLGWPSWRTYVRVANVHLAGFLVSLFNMDLVLT